MTYPFTQELPVLIKIFCQSLKFGRGIEKFFPCQSFLPTHDYNFSLLPFLLESVDIPSYSALSILLVQCKGGSLSFALTHTSCRFGSGLLDCSLIKAIDFSLRVQ